MRENPNKKTNKNKNQINNATQIKPNETKPNQTKPTQTN